MKIQNRNILTIIILAIIPILATGFLNYNIGIKNTKEAGVQEVNSIVSLLIKNLELQAKVFDKDLDFIIESKESKDINVVLENSLYLLNNPSYIRIEIYDKTAEKSYIIRDKKVEEKKLTWLSYIGNKEVKDTIPFVTTSTKELNLIKGNNKDFYVNLVLNKENLFSDISKIKVGLSGYSFVTDTDKGILITHPNENMLNKPLSNYVKEFSKVVDRSWDMNKPFEYVFEGKKKFLSYAEMTRYNWYVVAGTYYEEIESKFINVKRIIIAGIGIVFALSFLGLKSTNDAFVSPILRLSNNLKKVAKGDFSIRLEEKGDDEMKELSRIFNEFIVELGSLIENIRVEANEIVDSNLEFIDELKEIISGSDNNKGIVDLNIGIKSTMDNIRNQTSSTEETYAAIEQIRSNAESNKISADKTMEIVSDSVKLGEEGIKSIETLSNNITEINEKVEDTEREINDLSNFSHDIGNITGAIKELSEQTNLLSFNAAIEAARAGESGRGFAIVAEEIRKLAERTREESDKIKVIVGNIYSEIDRVKISTKEVKGRVEAGLESNVQVNLNLCSIVDSINETFTQAKEISLMTSEQNIASEEIGKAIENITVSAELIEKEESDNLETIGKIEEKLNNRVIFLDSIALRMKNLEEQLNKFKVK